MMYSIGLFVLDSEKEQIFVASTNELISDQVHSAQLLSILAEAYPKAVSKNELTNKLWRGGVVTDWALSTKIYRLRQLLALNDPNTLYIKTVHAQGFKLDIEPKKIIQPTLDESPQETVKHLTEAQHTAKKNQFKFSKWLGVTAIIFLIALCGIGYFKFKKPNPVYGEILPPKEVLLPLKQHWESSNPDSLKYTTEGILVAPIDSEPIYVSTRVSGPEFYQGAIFSMGIKLTQEFINYHGGLRFYYQSTQGGWPGEWDCILDDIKALDFTYECNIDEDGNFTKVAEKEYVNFGVKLHQQEPIGTVTITSARINLPAAISTEKGWRTTDSLPISYNRGVEFQPKSLASTLSTTIKGPTHNKETKLTVTLEVEDSYKNSEAGIVIFLIDKKRKWRDCFINGTDIKSNVFTKICEFKNTSLPFFLTENEKIDLGIAPYGKSINGKIKILGITLNK